MEELAALELATELKLITEDDALLAGEMLSKGIILHVDGRQWLIEIEAKVKEQTKKLKANPYQQYLDGGPKPMRNDGRPDWDAKDQHQVLTKQLTELEAFYKLAKGRINADSSTTYSSALETALKLMGVMEAFLALPISSQSMTFIQGVDDLRLCIAWSNTPGPMRRELDAAYLRQLLGDFEAGRLISARLAENSAANYYRALGHQVTDVSIMQLGQSDERWKRFDLLIDGSPVDVKNARRSFTSPEAYVQHCVPRFKTLREDGSDITVVGVLSDYIAPDQLVESVSKCRILGATSLSMINKLRGWAANRFGDILRLDGMWRPDYQPGWIFEYPKEHYRSRSQAVREIPELLKRLAAHAIPKSKLPVWLLSLSPDRSLALSMASPGLQSAILTDIYSLDDVVGLSRPSLFILIAGLFAEVIVKQDPAEALELTLRDLIFTKSKPDFRPLGLEDTQGYIGSLIDCLGRICTEAQSQGIQFKAFRMTHPSILRGERVDGRWMTLLAYCGGWIEQPFKVRCGASPLFFGKHEVCPECGYLACNTCGFCSQQCQQGHMRQRQIAEQNRTSSDEEYYNRLEL